MRLLTSYQWCGVVLCCVHAICCCLSVSAAEDSGALLAVAVEYAVSICALHNIRLVCKPHTWWRVRCMLDPRSCLPFRQCLFLKAIPCAVIACAVIISQAAGAAAPA
jgi:hypothetical protein